MLVSANELMRPLKAKAGQSGTTGSKLTSKAKSRQTMITTLQILTVLTHHDFQEILDYYPIGFRVRALAPLWKTDICGLLSLKEGKVKT